MGYTHYWARPRVLPRPQFIHAVDDCRCLCDALGIPLGGPDGNSNPVFSEDETCFNGHIDSGRLTSFQTVEGLIWPNQQARGMAVVGEKDAAAGDWVAGFTVRGRVLGSNGDGSYEAFWIKRECSLEDLQEHSVQVWLDGFCKTNYRPYDLCVQGCLIVLSYHLGTKRFRVASDGISRDWNDARDVCQHVLGYGIDWGEGNLAIGEPRPA